jgi:DNA-binding NtrC family response regulator
MASYGSYSKFPQRIPKFRDAGSPSVPSALPHFTVNGPEIEIEVDQLAASRMFVDDEPVIASTLAAVLNLRGYSSRAFSGPREALAAARADTPDLLLSEVVESDLCRMELAIRMKAQYPRCEVLIRCGLAQTADLLEFGRHRVHYFRLLVKPVFPAEILSAIDKIEAEPISQPKGRPSLGLRLVR